MFGDMKFTNKYQYSETVFGRQINECFSLLKDKPMPLVIDLYHINYMNLDSLPLVVPEELTLGYSSQ